MPKWSCRLPARTYEGSMDAMKIGRDRLTDVITRNVERMLDAVDVGTANVGRGRSPSPRSDFGAALWGGLAILLVKVAVAALILLAL